MVIDSCFHQVADHVPRVGASVAERIQLGPAGGGSYRGSDLTRSHFAGPRYGRRSARRFFNRAERAKPRVDSPRRREGTWESVVQVREEHDDLQLAPHS